MINKEAKQLYDELFNPKEALSEEEFLDKLIKIENITKNNIFRNLLNYTDKNKVKELIQLYGKQIVKNKSSVRNKLERQSLNKLIGKDTTIGEILDKYIEYIKEIFSEKTSLDKKLSSLKIAYDYIDGVIFPPEGDTRIQSGSGKGLKMREGYDRISLLFNDILSIKNNIYLGDFRVVIGKDDSNSLRKISYIVVEIPKLNKTIFVNNNYGEATYIYNGIPTDKSLLEKGKKSFRDECTKIKFNNVEQWKNQILTTLSKSNNSSKKTEYKNIKAKELKEVLSMEEKKEYIRNILNKDEIRKQWFSLSKSQRSRFKLPDGTGYVKIAGIIFGFPSKPHNLYKNEAFIELSKKIFGESDPEVTKLINGYVYLTIGSIKDLFTNNEQLKNQWFSLNGYRKRKKFRLPDGTSYIVIARIFDFKEEQDGLYKDEIFIELSKKIFGKNNPNVIQLSNGYVFHTENSIKNLFTNNERLKKQWFSLSANQRKDFRLPDGTRYVKIARIFDFKGERYKSSKDETFIELSKKIFGENDPKVIKLVNSYTLHTIDSIKDLFTNNERLKKQWLSLSAEQRREFKLPGGTSYIKIARIFGFHECNKKLYKDEIFIELNKKIFGENDPDVIHLINKSDYVRTIFLKNDLLKKQRFSLNTHKRKKFRLPDGTSYIKIARIFGFSEEIDNLNKNKIFIELSKKIFGENDPDIIQLSKRWSTK